MPDLTGRCEGRSTDGARCTEKAMGLYCGFNVCAKHANNPAHRRTQAADNARKAAKHDRLMQMLNCRKEYDTLKVSEIRAVLEGK